MTLWTVYIVTDPDSGQPLYVGLTKNLKTRITLHRCDPLSPLCGFLRDLRSKRINCTVTIFDAFEDRETAFRLEQRLILSIPGLLNKRAISDDHIIKVHDGRRPLDFPIRQRIAVRIERLGDMRRMIERLTRKGASREFIIAEARLAGLSLRDIAPHFGCSYEWIRQIDIRGKRAAP